MDSEQEINKLKKQMIILYALVIAFMIILVALGIQYQITQNKQEEINDIMMLFWEKQININENQGTINQQVLNILELLTP